MQLYKHLFPFRLGTTSFIYPADYATNVEKVGPYVDEIELLFFESPSTSMPSQVQIDRLRSLAQNLDLFYNVHLPSDIDLGSPEADERQRAIQSLSRVVKLVEPLAPTTHTLHLSYGEHDRSATAVLAWQNRTRQSLSQLLPGLPIDSRSISVETLDYPPEWFFPIVRELDLSVCLDVGHLLRYEFDLQRSMKMFYDRITILHLHGLLDGCDHRSLRGLPEDTRSILCPFLHRFRGSVSLEIFALDALEESLLTMKRMMTAEPTP